MTAPVQVEKATEAALSAKPWEAYGHGKHDYRSIDPDTINVDDYARNLRDEEANFGDIREYNSAFNTKHPDNDLTLDALSRVGTTFETEAKGLEGVWVVVQMPVVKSPLTYARCARLDEAGEPKEGTQTTISCIDLGCAVDDKNYFLEVKSKILAKGRVGRTQRERLTKKV